MGIEEITGHSLKTGFGELFFFLVKPTNISVLSESSISAKINALMTVLKGYADIGMLCMNSRESFENNKAFLHGRLQKETVPEIRRLVEQDLEYLDKIQIQMATAREFIFTLQLGSESKTEIHTSLARIEKGRQAGHNAPACRLF